MPDTLVTQEPVSTPASPVAPTPPATPSPTVPAAAPSDWRAALPDDLKADKSLEKFKSPVELARSYKQIEAYQGRSVAIPGPDAKPEEREAFWAKVGRPETPEQYTLPVPEGLPVDAGMAGDFKQRAHQLGLTQDQVAGLTSWFTGSAVGNPTIAGEQLATQAVTQLKAEWGGGYDHNLRLAQGAVRHTDRMSGAGLLPLLEQTGLGNHPAVLKHFKWLGGQFAEDGVLPKDATTGGILGPHDAEQKINELMRSPEYARGDRATVDEVQRLFQLKAAAM